MSELQDQAFGDGFIFGAILGVLFAVVMMAFYFWRFGGIQMSEEQKVKLEPIATIVPNLCLGILGFKEVQGLYDALNKILNYEAHPSFCDHVHRYANEALLNFKLLKNSLEEISGGNCD